MGYTLYDGYQTGGAVVRAALAEIGADFDVVITDLRRKDQQSTEYTRVNPRQQVPALLMQDGEVMTETAAILLHLADRHPEAGLLPEPGTKAHGQVLRWLIFCATNLYEGESRKLNPDRYTTGDPEPVRDAARAFIDRNYRVLEGAFADGPYLLGEDICVTDLYVWMLAQWHHDFDWLGAKCPGVMRCIRTVMDRPAVREVHLDQFGPGLGLGPLPPLE